MHKMVSRWQTNAEPLSYRIRDEFETTVVL
jgi:hypothetical protein